ncbi:MAG: hypothetical protein ACF8CQ_22690 [Rhodopirellula sp. JB044]|uniref:hypothetical protein n=1 Tax=Rhodopirellula sp. JB044 TaxID=3342844 RepID=UPI00370B1C03
MKRYLIGIGIALLGCSATAIAWNQLDRSDARGGRMHGERQHRKPNCGCPSKDIRCKEQQTNQEETAMTPPSKGTVIIESGYETDPRDGGRPVKLIAAALGVDEEIFRDAFSNVRPARGGHPTAQRAQANKEVLMNALEPHGVTNDRLDEVSNWYRYRPESGELWQHREAKLTPVIEKEQLVSIRVDDGGAGYLSTPEIRVAGFDNVRLQCELEFSEDLENNGQITSVTIVENEQSP